MIDSKNPRYPSSLSAIMLHNTSQIHFTFKYFYNMFNLWFSLNLDFENLINKFIFHGFVWSAESAGLILVPCLQGIFSISCRGSELSAPNVGSFSLSFLLSNQTSDIDQQIWKSSMRYEQNEQKQEFQYRLPRIQNPKLLPGHLGGLKHIKKLHKNSG